MRNTKFVVKVNRGGQRPTEYVKRIDWTPIETTTNRKLALIMGKFTAEDAVFIRDPALATAVIASGYNAAKTR